MKRILPTLMAVLAFAGLLGFVLYGPKETVTVKEEPLEKVVDLERDRITSLEVKGPDYLVSLAKESRKEGDQEKQVWVLKQPEGELETTRIDSLLFNFPLQAKKKMGEATDLAKYGLDKPQWTISLNGGETVVQVGAKNPAAGGYYARLQGSNTVWLIPSGLADGLPADPTGWVKKEEQK